MKFVKEVTGEKMAIPAAALKLCGFENGDKAELHALPSAAIILKQKMTAMEVIRASRDEELTYRLDDNEKAVLREKMDAYCTKETGLSLDDFCDSLMEMESTETLGLKM